MVPRKFSDVAPSGGADRPVARQFTATLKRRTDVGYCLYMQQVPSSVERAVKRLGSEMIQ